MNNKTKTYLLLALVLGIWGTVAYKIVNGLGSDLPIAENIEVETTFKPMDLGVKDTFSIKLPEKDPFLGTLVSKSKTSSTVTSSTRKQSYFPSVIYKGMVQNQQSKDKVFVLQIKSKQYLLKNGQIADSVKLVSGNAKSVTVIYKSQRKTLTLE